MNKTLALPKKRIEYIDLAKGLAIILVVLGHILNGGFCDDYIYSFHMPLFFMLAGITFKKYPEEKYFKSWTHQGQKRDGFFVKKLKTLMIPYYGFGIISIFFFYFLGQRSCSALDKNIHLSLAQMFFNLLYATSENGALKFYEPLWFLPCLFLIENILYFIVVLCEKIAPLTSKNKPLFFIGTFIILYLFNLLNQNVFRFPPLPLGYQKAMFEIYFFVIGFFFNDWFISNHLYRRVNLLLAALLIPLGCLLFILITKNGCSNPICAFWIGFMMTCFSCLGYISLCRFFGHCKILSSIGKETLAILVLHKYPILFFTIFFSSFNAHIKANAPLWVLALTIISLLTSFAGGYIIKILCPPLLGQRFSQKKINIVKS